MDMVPRLLDYIGSYPLRRRERVQGPAERLHTQGSARSLQPAEPPRQRRDPVRAAVPAHGDEQELRDQLNGCKAVILRSACVQLELLNYWKDSVAVSCNASVTPRAVHVPEPSVTPRNVREEVVEIKQKRTREEEKAPKKKKAKVMERSGDIFEEKVGAMTASLEKARWSRMGLSHRDSVACGWKRREHRVHQTLIDGVVESAATDL
ncbi:hypothetical protein GQ600_14817 [Phytophthora cactorum]|nr:hypothetical protein GQ600_14817 [Phytophthora cactorum]